ncbi:transmembrane protein 6/97, partial [Mycena floridula]
PLTARPLHLVYFIFFATHIPASLLIDLQALFGAPFPYLIEWYISMSGDPLISGMLRGNSDLVWFQTFLWLEMLFQVPVFFLGMWGLLKENQSIYMLLVVYGASTATTTLPCIFYIVSKADKVTSFQLLTLLGSYIPFFLIPLMICVDMAYSLSR